MTGQLIFSDGLPVANAEISLSVYGVRDIADSVLTDAQGRFSFTDLSEGTFMVSAHRNDLGSFLWGQTQQLGTVTSVTLNEKYPSYDFVFRIERFGTIVGTVHNAEGNPLPHMQVSAARRSWGNGKAGMQVNGSTMTDDLGRFRIPYVGHGRYRVCVANPFHSEIALPIGYANFGESAREIYAPSCVPDLRSNNLISITPGKKLDMDLVFSPQIPVEVSGTVLNIPDNQSLLVMLEPMDTSGAAQTSLAQVSGDANEFHFKDVMPGRYWVVAQSSVDRYARVAVTVEDSGVSGVQLALARPPIIDVAVHAPQHAGKITVGLRDADDPFSGATDAVEQPDGSLRIALQHSGRYWLVTRAELCPAIARFGEIDAMDHAVEIEPGANGPLEVTFTDQCGDLVASVVDHEGKPVLEARLLILLTGTPDDPGDLFVDALQTDGTYSFVGMTPGAYSLWAWDESEEWNGTLSDLKALKSQQTVVEIKAGNRATVKVPLLSAFDQEAK